MNRLNAVIMTIWIILIVMIIVYFRIGYVEYTKEIDEIIKKSINGYIVNTKDAKRGFQYIDIREGNDTISYTLYGSYFFDINNIQISDSVSKKANSDIMIFYKLKNGIYEKCCETGIGLD